MTVERFERIAPGVVRVHEHAFSYDLTEDELRKGLSYTKSHQAYFHPEYFQERIKFYEGALAELTKESQS